MVRTAKRLQGPLTFAIVVGRWIRKERKARSWNQADLKKASGIPQPDLSAFENGKKNIAATHIDALLRAFKIEPRDLFHLLTGTVPEVERELRESEKAEAEQPVKPVYAEEDDYTRKVSPRTPAVAPSKESKKDEGKVSASPPTTRESR